MLGDCDARVGLRLGPPSDAEAVNIGGLYERLEALGYKYGPGFRGLQEVYKQGAVLYGMAKLPHDLQAGQYKLHPALLDSVLHTLWAATQSTSELMLPFALEAVAVHVAGVTLLRVQARVQEVSSGWEAQLKLYGENGELIAEVGRVKVRPVGTASVLHALGGEQTSQPSASAAAKRAPEDVEGSASRVMERLRALPGPQREQELLAVIQREVAAILQLPAAAAVPPDQALRDLGLDSLTAIETRVSSL